MAVERKIGSVLVTNGAVNTTYVVNDCGFQPDAIIFWWNGSTATTNTTGRGNVFGGWGFATSSTNRGCSWFLENDAASTSSSAKGISTVAICKTYTANGTIDGALDISSIDSGGFTLIVDDAFTTLIPRIHYIALGGDITNAFVGEWDPATNTTGNIGVTGVGFTPELILFASPGTNSASGLDVGAMFGAATASNQQWVINAGSNSGATTQQTLRYGNGDQVIHSYVANMSGEDNEGAFVSFDADGFTVNMIDASASSRGFLYLCLAGGDYLVGDLLTQTDTSTQIVKSGMGWKPSVVLIGSHCTTETAAGAEQDHAIQSFGAFTSATDRRATAWAVPDATTGAQASNSVYYDAAYINLSSAHAVQGLMDVVSMDSGGFTLIMDDADPSQSFFGFVAIGPAPAGSATYSNTITPVTAALSSEGKTNTVSTNTAALQSTKSNTVNTVTTAVQSTKSNTVSTVTTALQSTKSNTVSTVTAALTSTKSNTITSPSVALQSLGLTATASSNSASLSTTGTNTVSSVSTALQSTISRTCSSVTAALQATLSRTVTPTSSALQSTLQREVAGTAALTIQSQRTVTPLSTALQATLSRSVLSNTAALQSTLSNIVGADASLVSERTITDVTASLSLPYGATVTSVTAALQSTLQRQVTATSAILQTLSRTITSVTTALVAEQSRTLSSNTTALQATLSLPITSTATLQRSLSRTVSSVTASLSSTSVPASAVSSTAALQSTLSRTIGADAAISGGLSRAVPTEVALQQTLTRISSATTALSETLSRTVSSNTISLLGTFSRAVISTTAINATLSRIVTPVTLTAQKTLQRQVTSTTSITDAKEREVTNVTAHLMRFDITRTVSVNAALTSTLTRTVAQTTALQQVLIRQLTSAAALQESISLSLPLSTAIQSTLTREVNATAHVTTTYTRSFALTATLQLTTNFIIPATVSICDVFMKTVTTSAVLKGGVRNIRGNVFTTVRNVNTSTSKKMKGNTYSV